MAWIEWDNIDISMGAADRMYMYRVRRDGGGGGCVGMWGGVYTCRNVGIGMGVFEDVGRNRRAYMESDPRLLEYV